MAQAFWASQILYKFTINPTKISINLLYLRIFPPSQNPRFATAVRIVAVYIGLYMFASVGATIFLCTPVARAWDRGVEGHCINLEAFWYSNAISNIVGDIATLALPNPDTTYGTLEPTLWSNIEANTAIFCACLPTLKKLLVAFYHRCTTPTPRDSGTSHHAWERRFSRPLVGWGLTWSI
ncbi:MAG: hypothetical protein Q9184_002026 [Pyrenodesmia sp. 2 TL-2023]